MRVPLVDGKRTSSRRLADITLRCNRVGYSQSLWLRGGDVDDSCRRGDESASRIEPQYLPADSVETNAAGDLRGAAGETQRVLPPADGPGVALSQRSMMKGNL
jgi:hypothetical protein